jgi:nucleoside 2-deoxyribosyltransferase
MGAVSTPIYLASPLGFTAAGRLYNEQVLLPAVRDGGLRPLDPWEADNPATQQLLAALALPDGPGRRPVLREANEQVAARNVALIDEAAGLLAVLDGSDVDSGTAAEIGYASARGIPIVGVRTDFRLAGDNDGSIVNLQVEYFVTRTGGRLVVDVATAVAALAAVLTGP